MNIHHRPIFDTERTCEHYSKKDGVLITYVCTSALGGEAQAMDIFYRETPHPEFGNKYFGLFHNGDHVMITNADKVEELEFDMVQDEQGVYHYSRHRHDYYTVDNVTIDGGRAYTRIGGDIGSVVRATFVVRSGLFYEKDEVE